MVDIISKNKPKIHSKIEAKSKAIGFTMPSDLYIGSLLKTLIASKPNAHILELGTGIGLSLSWMIDGMDADSRLISVDNDPELIKISTEFFGTDKRVQLICEDGSVWLKNYKGEKFDVIFADAWPGKYSEIEEVLNLVKVGGFYIIDDMAKQENWPEGHEKHVTDLVCYLDAREDFKLTKLNWSTGLIIAVRSN
ncbi:O-methyltransferase family 3 [Cellulophaga algicola DSM 14237]|uniref:O-methyltransferase family 3 n=1 Tax=Cellulophaga algicola (strain DSM 14237 / IC166 / ACAM 630) TaxID=688270 RepID=E6X9V6_CELAD|nr:class I SAM-dependent methyltransferase [Cellulophaga algicola]ADV50917.1 O-methyltransferase family 3 [Cellulophaga algicola DSM 14237]